MNRVIIIAEAGVNHNGDMSAAKQLIDAAVDAGADFVKFQSFKADKLVSPTAKKAAYQIKNIGNADDRQYAMLKKLELSHADHQELISYCQNSGIRFLSTAFDTDGLDYLNSLGLDRFKVPSGEITNFPYLHKLASLGKSVILSTGMADMQEIEAAVDILTTDQLTRADITVLHCNTEYPTPMKDVNLKAMLSIQQHLGIEVGYSDHTLGIEVPIAAVALGASVVEKHFTLDRGLPGPDHRASLEPTELTAMVRAIRNIELAMSGDGTKKASQSEIANKTVARKSIHLAQSVRSGARLGEKDLIPLRPGDGISPMEWPRLIGKKVLRDLDRHHQLQWTDLQ